MDSYTVKSTTDYGLFKTLRTNRLVSRKHVKALEMSLLEEDLSAARPILVNGDMEVVDGQHMLQALKNLKLPVYYTEATRATQESVMRLNSRVKKWTNWDFVESYAKQGKQDYKTLKTFIESSGLSVSGVLILFSDTGNSNSSLFNSMRRGDFKADTLALAKKRLELLNLIRKHGQPGIAGSKSFIASIARLMKNPAFDINRFTKCILSKSKSSFLDRDYLFHKHFSSRDHLREFEEVYNFNYRKMGHKKIVRLF